jgi:hypothetical protein
MTAFKTVLAGGVAAAALISAAPAAAQYYPGYGYGNNGGVIGQVINQVLGGGGGYGVNSQAAIDRCAAAVTQRINRDYGYRSGAYNPYGGYGGYNGYAAGNARVVGITSVERRSSNGLRVRGVATANAYAGYGGYGGGYSGYGGYGGGYAQQAPAELTFKCNIDYRGYITDIDLNRNTYAYGYRGY